MPFSDILTPLATASAGRFRAHLSARGTPLSSGAMSGAPLSSGAMSGAVRGLVERLNAVAAPVLAEAFRQGEPPPAVARLFDDTPDFAPRDRYAAFRASVLDGTGTPALDRWPVLRDRLAEICADWERNLAAFAAHLAEDGAALRALRPGWGHTPPPVSDLQTGLSDPHAGGRSVFQVAFEDGTCLAYKPRPLAVEHAFGRLLAQIQQDASVPRQRVPLVLDAGDHGWMEWIEAAPLADAAEACAYMERCGGLLALVDLLRGGDIHPDNLIPAGAFPVIVDLECLFQPGPADLGQADPLDDPHLFSSGILPVFTSFDGGATMAAIAAAGAGPVPHRPETCVRHPGTDWLHLGNRPVPSFSQGPQLDGRILDVRDHAADVVRGYRATLGALLRHREALLAEGGALDAFRDAPCRLLCAPTNLYALVLAPALMGDGARSEAAFATRLARAAGRPPLMAAPAHWRRVLDAEAAALARLDVPAFTFRPSEGEAHALEGAPLGTVFERPMFARVEARLRALDAEAIADRARLVAGAITPALPPAPDAADSSAAAVLRLCARRVAALAVPQADGVVWMRLWEQMPALVAPAGPGLYYGSAGIAVFLAEAGRVLGEADLLDMARRALQPTRTLLREGGAAPLAARVGAGYARGLGGIIAALCWCADLLAAPELVEDALRLSRATAAALAVPTGVPDVMEGAAGLALGLGVLARSAPGDAGVRAAMALCGRTLCEASQMLEAGRRHWPERQRPGQPGLSHGAAGMAAALAHACRVTGEAAFRDAALEALAHEDALFDPSAGNWTGGGKASPLHQALSSWCHGAPGIALARAMILETLGAPAAARAPALHTALDLTQATRAAGGDDLCCGEAGRLEILSVLGARLGRSDLLDVAGTALAERLPDWARGEARFMAGAAPRAPDDAALFRGWAGIGHLLVRHLAPGTARDVLLP